MEPIVAAKKEKFLIKENIFNHMTGHNISNLTRLIYINSMRILIITFTRYINNKRFMECTS